MNEPKIKRVFAACVKCGAIGGAFEYCCDGFDCDIQTMFTRADMAVAVMAAYNEYQGDEEDAAAFVDSLLEPEPVAKIIKVTR